MIFTVAHADRICCPPRAIGQPSPAAPPEGMSPAIDAIYSWIASEIPKIEAWAADWISRVPANPTQAQAQALAKELGQARADFSNSYQAYVYQPWSVLWDANADHPVVQKANQDFSAAFTAAFAPAQAVANERVKWAALGKTQEQAETDQAIRQQEWANAQAGWDAWDAQSAPLLAELRQIYEFTRANPQTPGQNELRNRALELRLALFAIADATIGTVAIPEGWPKSKTHARAREIAQLAFDEPDSQIRSNAKLAGWELERERERQQQNGDGGAIVYDGGYPVQVPPGPPAPATIMGLSPVVVGLALLLLILAMRGRR